MSPLTKGYVAMSVVLLIWSGFALTVRAVGASSLSIADVMLIRFSVPLVLLTPFGASTVPAAYMGTILTGTPVFFAALLSFILYRQRISLRKFASLILILFGIATMIGGHAQAIPNSLLYGVGLLLMASLIWAGYTLGLKSTTLTPIAIAIVLSYTSFFLTLVMVLSGIMDTNIGSVSFDEVLPFILIQGLGVGVVSTIAFSYAVKQLGSIRTLLLGSLSPGLTAILAALILKESLSVIMIGGIALSTIGVILSNRAK